MILCSGFNTTLDEQKAAAMGIQAYIRKPFLIEQLARSIRTVLDKNRRGEIDKDKKRIEAIFSQNKS